MNTERDMTHISTLLEATKTWSNQHDKRRVKFLERNDKQRTLQSSAKQ